MISVMTAFIQWSKSGGDLELHETFLRYRTRLQRELPLGAPEEHEGSLKSTRDQSRSQGAGVPQGAFIWRDGAVWYTSEEIGKNRELL